MNTHNSGRIIYLDLLRIFAVFMVILLHTSAQNWGGYEVKTVYWVAINMYNGLSQYCVAIFVMISGTLFLNPNYKGDIATLYSKNIPRIIIAYGFWSFIYVVKDYIISGYTLTPLNIIKGFLLGHYHLWFCFMIVGLYVVIPFLRKICQSVTLMRYFLLLSLIFTFACTTIMRFIPRIELLYDKMQFHFTLGYVSYYVLGYYLSTGVFSKKIKYSLYVLGILSFIFSTVGSTLFSFYFNKPIGFANDFLLNILFEAIAIYIFFKDHFINYNPEGKKSYIIKTISKASFGIYLVHALVIETMEYFGFSSISFCSLVAVPLVAVTVFVISLIISILLRKIPYIRRFVG